MLNFLDRQVVNILAESIKNELHLSDTQVGLMTGLMFAIFYTLLGIPIARIAERFSRPWLIAGSMALWSGFTALCGMTSSFGQLLLARLGVGFGEAGCTPSAHSMIADDTPPRDRSFALGFYAMGTPLGTLLGFAMGGIVADNYGWRTAFFVAGAPGILLAIVAALTLREPRRRMAAHVAAKAQRAGAVETLAYLMKKPTFWCVSVAAAMCAFTGYGQNAFIASFYLRNHPAEVAHLASSFGLQSKGFLGLAIGLVGGVCGAIGSIVGGRVIDRVSERTGAKATVTLPALALIIWAPLYAVVILLPSAGMSLLLFAVPSIVSTVWYGPTLFHGPERRPTAHARHLLGAAAFHHQRHRTGAGSSDLWRDQRLCLWVAWIGVSGRGQVRHALQLRLQYDRDRLVLLRPAPHLPGYRQLVAKRR